MKRTIFIILLLTSCFLKPAAFSIIHDLSWDMLNRDLIPRAQFQKELAACRYLALYGLLRLAQAPMFHDAHAPLIIGQVPGQQAIDRIHVQNNVQKKPRQKRYYHYQNIKNNNRVDRQHHAHINMRIQQPRNKKYK